MRKAIGAMAAMLVALATQAAAQEPAKTILVLDGSGSMWGQIEGEAKITIAQRVVGELLGQIGDRPLGLTVYGHRRKGDCGDIETVVEPGDGTAEAILGAVNGIKPKGKTPLSAAVIAAAEALKYEEDPATVILVSDGRETCDLDPCEVGRRLEETGVGFTAHVIGFDVAKEEDRAQLRCLAENTGGRFLTASNAAELNEALAEVSEAAPPPPPEPERVDMSFEAVAGEGGPPVTRGLTWTLTGPDGPIVEDFGVATLRMALAPGAYRVAVTRADDAQTVEEDLTVGEDGRTVTLVLADLTPDATISAPAEAVAGSTILVEWTGPDEKNDYLSAASPEDSGGEQVTYTYTRDGSPLKLELPIVAGDYEVRYVRSQGREVLARHAITVTPVEVALAAPAEAVAGATVAVEWTGPDYKNDHIAVASPDGTGAETVNYSYTRDGAPAKLLMPAEPGDYEIRYIANQGRTILARQSVTVTEVAASVSAPAEVVAGSTVAVEWMGPDYQNDHITVAKPDDTGAQSVNYTYTRDGAPARLLMPTQPGDYEIRYIANQDRTILARQAVSVTDVAATLEAPAEVVAGSTVTVEWTGPDYQNDHIAVARPDDTGSQSVNYSYTRDGAPAKLLMPAEPGEYEIRYIANQDRTILARKAVTVTEVSATLDAPAEVVAGSTVAVEWTGPDYQNDHIAVAKPDDTGSQSVNYAYTRDGAPAKLLMPADPGEFEIRYIANQDRTILARKAVTVTEVTATVEGSAEAVAGALVEIVWTGPDYSNDHIAVAEPGAPGNRTINHAYTRDGAPAKLLMPPEPGTYEIRYIQDQGRTVLATASVTVTEATAALNAPASAPVGSTVAVEWQGPDNRNDFIAIAGAGQEDGQQIAHAYTRDGSPAKLRLPGEPGVYELRYVMGQGRRVLARLAIEAADVAATLEAADAGKPGNRLRVDWTGPGNRQDRIAIARPDQPDNETLSQTPAAKSPLMVNLPDEPGTYELRYIVEGRVIARRPVTVE